MPIIGLSSQPVAKLARFIMLPITLLVSRWKEIGDDFVKNLADKGCVFQPKQVNVLALECGLRVAEAQSIAA